MIQNPVVQNEEEETYDVFFLHDPYGSGKGATVFYSQSGEGKSSSMPYSSSGYHIQMPAGLITIKSAYNADASVTSGDAERLEVISTASGTDRNNVTIINIAGDCQIGLN